MGNDVEKYAYFVNIDKMEVSKVKVIDITDFGDFFIQDEDNKRLSTVLGDYVFAYTEEGKIEAEKFLKDKVLEIMDDMQKRIDLIKEKML